MTTSSWRVSHGLPPSFRVRRANSPSPVTERARKLRSNYNVHAQSLRTRIEIRVNRIPLSLRKAKMGDLLQKYSAQYTGRSQQTASQSIAAPPVPQKDAVSGRIPLQRSHPVNPASPARHGKRHRFVAPPTDESVHALTSPR